MNSLDSKFDSTAFASDEDGDERLQRLNDFLRECRLGIPIETKSLGRFIRLPNRIGKIVSQEELAEAIGVSRCWYGMLEGGRRVQPSIALIDRICDALMLDDLKRLQLVELAFPAFSQLLPKTIFAQASRAA